MRNAEKKKCNFFWILVILVERQMPGFIDMHFDDVDCCYGTITFDRLQQISRINGYCTRNEMRWLKTVQAHAFWLKLLLPSQMSIEHVKESTCAKCQHFVLIYDQMTANSHRGYSKCCDSHVWCICMNKITEFCMRLNDRKIVAQQPTLS